MGGRRVFGCSPAHGSLRVCWKGGARCDNLRAGGSGGGRDRTLAQHVARGQEAVTNLA